MKYRVGELYIAMAYLSTPFIVEITKVRADTLDFSGNSYVMFPWADKNMILITAVFCKDDNEL